MGMYTEIYVNLDLKPTTPPDVIEVLRAIVNYDTDAECLAPYPPQWARLFANGSYYTPSTCAASLTFDEISGCYSLIGKGDIKNYDNEIHAFFDFIMPWCEDPDAFIGYYRYEEHREPTLVFSPDV